VSCLNFAMKVHTRDELDLPPGSPREQNPFARWTKNVPDAKLSDAKRDLMLTASPLVAARRAQGKGEKGQSQPGAYNARVEFLKQLLVKQEENEADFRKLSQGRKKARTRNALRLWWCSAKLIAYRHALKAERSIQRADDAAEQFVFRTDESFADKRRELREARQWAAEQRERARARERLKHVQIEKVAVGGAAASVLEKRDSNLPSKDKGILKILIATTQDEGSDSYDLEELKVSARHRGLVSAEDTRVLTQEQKEQQQQEETSEWAKFKAEKDKRMSEAERTMAEVQLLREQSDALTNAKRDGDKFDFAKFMQANREKEREDAAAAAKKARKKKRKTKEERQQDAYDKKFNKSKWLKNKQKAKKAAQRAREAEELKAIQDDARCVVHNCMRVCQSV
jgi:hypothetical protein